MKLSKKQFEVLAFIEGSENKKSQREIADKTKLSAGTVNKIISELSSEGLIDNGAVTEKGYEALEPYRVKRAIFIAAGFGSRLVPITLNTPKPLVRVNGVRMIDTLLDAVVAAGMIRFKYIMVPYVLCGIMEVFVGSMRGMGYVMAPMIVSLIGACVLRLIWIGTIFQVDRFHTIGMLYLIYPISWVVTTIAHIVTYIVIRKKMGK